MTTLNLHEVYVLADTMSNRIIAVYESKEEAKENAKRITEKYGAKCKIVKADFFGKLPI